MATIEILNSYLTESDLARQLGKSERTLQRWRRLRIGPAATTVGNRVLYDVQDVRAWLRAQRQEVTRARAS
jgi:hypothetical protein